MFFFVKEKITLMYLFIFKGKMLFLNAQREYLTSVITYMKKLLDSAWLRKEYKNV